MKYIYIGVFEKEQLIKVNFRLTQNYKGLYCIDNLGYVYHFEDDSQHTKQSNIRFKLND